MQDFVHQQYGHNTLDLFTQPQDRSSDRALVAGALMLCRLRSLWSRSGTRQLVPIYEQRVMTEVAWPSQQAKC